MSLLPSPRRNFVYFVLCGLCLIFALGSIALFIAGKTTFLWDTTTGKLFSASIYRPTPAKVNRPFYPVLAYEYTVKGKTYIGGFTKIGGLSFLYEPDAERYINEKKKLATLPVYYSPLFPSVAFLERGASTSLWFIAGAGFAFYILLRMFSLMKQQKNG